MQETSNTPARTSKSVAASFNLKRSDETLTLAKDLANFIKENKLSTVVQGKDFVNVEGWQYAGSRLGIVPIVEEVISLSTDTELKYQARVTLYDLNNKATVGAGFAICSNKEQGKKFYQEFAIASMAQTRAVGKAYRNILAWIIRAAGYEPTPAEEMDNSGNEPGTGAVEVKPMQAVQVEQAAPLAGTATYATAQQKEEIIRLLNHPVITRQEKTKMLLNINKLDQERATQAIANLRKTIDERENGDTPDDALRKELNAARTELLHYLDAHDQYFDALPKKQQVLRDSAWQVTTVKEMHGLLTEAREIVAGQQQKISA
ncbi:hypothetical protein [Solirubrum puertoriconensis]|uniref:hypothetical protein n=1 Tax=Solirubrum puertoriconensis TaxID=1751427 RepID=UPI000ADB793C|nr:hypothetical protein [Solirubrum puertoriconensis]